MKTKKVYRQGDVFLAGCQELPKGARRLDHTILARGEVTNHVHEVEDCELYEKDGTIYVKPISAQPRLVHKDAGAAYIPGTHHDPVPLTDFPLYEFAPQREYQPEGWNRVVD